MKVGILLDDSLDRPDGVQQYVLTLGRWLTYKGHEIHYLTSNTSRTDIPNVHSLSGNIAVKFNKNRLAIPRKSSLDDISKLITRVKLDVLHVQIPYSPMLGGRVLKILPSSVARVGTFHIMPSGALSTIGTKLLGILQSKNLNSFDSFTAVSQPARQFAKTYGVEAVVLPNAVDIIAYRPKKTLRQNKVPKIVFLGRLVPRKGCEYLLQAVHRLHQKYPDLKFEVIIGGEGPLRPNLEKFIHSKRLTEFVKLKGFIAEAAKPEFLAQADLAVFPATSGESFGIVLIEAMAADSQVVLAGHNPGYSSVMNGDTRTLVNPRDTAVFAKRLHDLIEDKDLREVLHKAQQALLKLYDINVVGPKTLDIYKTAIAKRLSKVA